MKPFEHQTYYELLEIPVTAPDDEIRAAYTRALETYSPDSVAVYALVEPGQLDALRARLTEAMEILTEPDLRAEYDRMIGVDRAASNTVVAPLPSLVEASNETQAVAAPAPAPSEASIDQAPSQAPAAAASSAAAPEMPSATPAPLTLSPSPEQLVLPGMVAAAQVVTPGQIQAAFGSYAISYVPVLVPAPSLGGSAFFSPLTIPAPTGGLPGQEARSAEAAPPAPSSAPAPEATAAQPLAPSSESTPSPASGSSPAASAEGAPHGTGSPASVSGTPAEAAPAPAAPAAAELVEAPGPAQASAEPALAEDLPEQPVSSAVLLHHEEDELSGVRAPLPSRAGTHAPSSSPASASPSPPPVAAHRPTTTPPPLPPTGRRIPRSTPAGPSGEQAGDPGKGSGRPAPAVGLSLEEAQQISQESAIATAEAALAQVHAKAREPRPKPIDLPPHTEFNGELLRRVRESRGLSLQQLADRTRISTKHLENVEADRYAALPATVYLRGILMNIARELTLDPLRVARSYLTLASEPKKK
jgi:hypothetical protein